MFDLRLVGIVAVGCGVLVEVLKAQGTKTNILALLSTFFGVILTLGVLGYDGGVQVITEKVVLGAVIGASTSGIYDIGKGLKQAFQIRKSIELFDTLEGGVDLDVEPIDFP